MGWSRAYELALRCRAIQEIKIAKRLQAQADEDAKRLQAQADEDAREAERKVAISLAARRKIPQRVTNILKDLTRLAIQGNGADDYYYLDFSDLGEYVGELKQALRDEGLIVERWGIRDHKVQLPKLA